MPKIEALNGVMLMAESLAGKKPRLGEALRMSLAPFAVDCFFEDPLWVLLPCSKADHNISVGNHRSSFASQLVSVALIRLRSAK